MRSLKTLCLVLAALFVSSVALAQVRTSGQIVGTVQDPTGAVVPGAKVVVVDEATGTTKETSSGPDGRFVVPDLVNGTYRITVTSQGFRTAVYPGVKVDVGLTSNITIKLELGTSAETITVEAGTDVLQTTSPTLESTVSGRILRGLPLNNRDVLDFVLLLPGAQQAGSARQSTFEGLPKGAINITMDGLNVQDNLLKSSFGGGMFTLIRPKVDNVEEISVTSAAGGADAAGEGAIQIRFVTRRGGNDFHGNGFWQWRHESFNANTWINNAQGRFTTGPNAGAEHNPRNINRLHQYGFVLGGPIIKDKAFFFFSYEDFRLPAATQRNNRVLTLRAQQGFFSYKPTATQTATPATFVTCGAGTAPDQVCEANLFGLAAAQPATFDCDLTAAGNQPCPSTLDPLTQSMLGVINNIVASGRSSLDLFRDRFIYAIPSPQRRWFPTMRLDWNITQKLRWHGVANYNRFISTPDTLNRMDPAFPGTGFIGGQYSDRFSLTSGVNWEIRPNITYELRVGRQSSVVQFFPETAPFVGSQDLLGLFTQNFRLVWPLGVTSLHARPSATDNVGTQTTRSLPSSRTTPVFQWGNNIGWLKGKHSMNFGTSLTVVTSWDNSFGAAGLPTVTPGLATTDPARSFIVRGTNIPGLANGTVIGGVTTPDDQADARNLYAMLVGRINTISGSINVDEITKQYVNLAPLTRRDRQNEFGVYVTDQWRLFPSLTVTGGIRWEYQGIAYNLNDIYTGPSYEDIWGRSGVGNLFTPSLTPSGNANPQLALRTRDLAQRYFNAWAPSLGLAWTPKNDSTWYKWIFGGSNKSVFRGGFGIAFTREGFTHFPTFAGGNPGLTQAVSATSGTDFAAGPLVTDVATVLADITPTPATFSFPVPMSLFTFNTTNNVLTYDPNLRPAYVQSWNLSWQRELSPSMAIDIRYVGNHGTSLWRSYNLNEINIFGDVGGGYRFLDEFMRAKANLDICRANTTFDPMTGAPNGGACFNAQVTAGVPVSSRTADSFNNWSLPGQMPLPILTAAFSGVPGTASGSFASAVNTTSAGGVNGASGFRSSTFVQFLDQGRAGNFANSLATSGTYICRLAGNQLGACSLLNRTGVPPVVQPLGAGIFPANIFMVNPDTITPGAFVLTNDGNSTYNAFQIEFRRRLSKGIELNANYSFSKSITDKYDDSATNTNTFTTLRDKGYDKGLSPFDITHTVRIFGGYEFPFGPGRKWGSSNSIVNRLIEGWKLTSVVALQSGRPVRLTSGRGTFTNADSGVVLAPGVTREQLQNAMRINQVGGRTFVYFFDPSLVGSGAYPQPPASANQIANSAFLLSPTTPGQLGQRVFLKGPKFFKPDFGIVKTTTVTERVKVEFRTQIFNAVNYTNWLIGGPGAAADTQSINSTSFGQTTNFLNDLGNQDQGPRMIEFHLKIIF